jgi:hypothetical protein
MHFWDWCIADRWVPELSFGFATLEKYPDADPETNTMDGKVNLEYDVDTNLYTWFNLRDASVGNEVSDSVAEESYMQIGCDSSSGKFRHLKRSAFLFDTSALTTAAIISAATLSFYGLAAENLKEDTAGWALTTDVYTCTPASNTALVLEDYDQFGTTSQTGSPITYASWTASAYNVFTLDSTGRGNISLSGTTKFALRSVADANNSPPTWYNNLRCWVAGYYADQTGTANDPKLVVTYTTSLGGVIMISWAGAVLIKNPLLSRRWLFFPHRWLR